MNAFPIAPISRRDGVIEWNEGELTAEQAARMTDEEIAARMEEIQARVAALRRRQAIALEVLAERDPELAAEMRKQMGL